MNRDLSLDSLIVKILGRIWEPTIPTQELRDLVVLLPAAVHAERAAFETRVAELEKKIGGGGGSKKSIDLDAQKQIQTLRSINGTLRSNILRLEQSKNPEIGTSLQNEIHKLKTINGGIKSDIWKLKGTLKQSTATSSQHPALKELNKLNSISGGVEADTRRLEQVVKDGKAENYRVKTCNYGNATTNTSAKDKVTKGESIQRPVSDPQSHNRTVEMTPLADLAHAVLQASTLAGSKPCATHSFNSAAVPHTTASKHQVPSWDAAKFPSSGASAYSLPNSKPPLLSQNTGGLSAPSSQHSPSLAVKGAATAKSMSSLSATSRPVNGNQQPQTQTSNRLPPSDPRTQLYSASPDGMYFPSSEPAGAKHTPMPDQNNDKPIIHPSRLSQMEGWVSPPTGDPRMLGRISTTNNPKIARIPPPSEINQKTLVRTEDSLPSANLSGESQPTVASKDRKSNCSRLVVDLTTPESNLPSSTGLLDLPKAPAEHRHPPRLVGQGTTTTGNKVVVSSFGNTTEQSQSQAPNSSTSRRAEIVPWSNGPLCPMEPWKPTFNNSYRNSASLGAAVSSPFSEGAPPSPHSELNSMTPIAAKKRAASLSIEVDATKKTKVSSTDSDGDDKSLSSLDHDIEELQAKYVQAKQRLTAPPGFNGKDATIPDPQPNLAPVAAAAVAKSKDHERRDSAVAITAFFNPDPIELDARQPTCMHCRFTNLECNHKSPCQNCEAQMNACVYWHCEYEEECTAPNCWYSHEPEQEEVEELSPGMVAASHT